MPGSACAAARARCGRHGQNQKQQRHSQRCKHSGLEPGITPDSNARHGGEHGTAGGCEQWYGGPSTQDHGVVRAPVRAIARHLQRTPSHLFDPSAGVPVRSGQAPQVPSAGDRTHRAGRVVTTGNSAWNLPILPSEGSRVARDRPARDIWPASRAHWPYSAQAPSAKLPITRMLTPPAATSLCGQ